ncbi:pyridoxal phosphate-dependent aminotransferase [Hymenobacter sp. HSC-4F20]|uniref:pyridoxal phosphate-dependent aminotransferase n=1 Tax=Hymenobacter sp. HSC-4F20 TaxID=2864135 RepID=UPI001C73AF74|nr:pyridoxal phosphate-dependent aminotransferase [Hymenobacter sp. HSC-4F20]MBX0288972.1 pyridoxal phosphate-dependent aminotransferase [Hymenobacter sp. HSC-4F20]
MSFPDSAAPISLASGYGSFLPPPEAVAAASRLLEAGTLPLSDTAGLLPLRHAVATSCQQAGSAVQPDNVVVTAGTKAALFALLRTVLRPGDEVLLPTPNWFGFGELVARAGGTLRPLPLHPEDNYALPPELLQAALTPRTRVVLFSNPNNPTGRVYSRAEVAAWLAVTREFPEVFVLSDEIYDRIAFGASPVPSLLSFPDPHGRHLVVNGFSKSLALIGWGVGYLVAPLPQARAAAAWQHATAGAVPAPAQHAALVATEQAPQIAAGLLAQLHDTRQLMLQELTALPRVPALQPEATYYAFPDLRAYLQPTLPPAEASAELVARLHAAGVTVVDGGACGAPGFARLSYALPEPQLREALQRLRAGLGKPRAAG